MKRHGNLFTRICSEENVRLAYMNARRGKTWQNTVKNFERDLEPNLQAIRELLADGTYRTSEYHTKVITEPKVRTIYKLPFAPDRIVQHAMMNVLEPIWESMFIPDSYACRIDKGAHAGSQRTMQFVRRNRYCMKADIRSFYPSMDHDVMFRIIRRKIKCRQTLALIEDILYSIGGGRNIPIGNYTSQWMGNLYLNELDQRVKHVHKGRDYIRYCDDFLLFSDDKAYLQSVRSDLREWLQNELKLTMSKDKVFPTAQGVDFLGYRHFGRYILLRKSTAARMKRRIRKLPHLLEVGEISPQQYRSSLASMMGWLKHANTYHLRQSLGIDRMLAEAE